MRGMTILASALLLMAGSGEAGDAVTKGQPAWTVAYDEWFTDAGMRVDLYATATAASLTVGLDEIVMEPVWAGTRVNLIDLSGYGAMRYRVNDAASGMPLFEQGYSTLLGEWRTTPEALTTTRTMGESLRFPFPKEPVRVILLAKDKKNVLREVLRLDIDPASTSINRSKAFSDVSVVLLRGKDDPRRQADLTILPDGYTRGQGEKMRADAKRFADMLLRHEPFSSRGDRISVRLVLAFSNESGPDEPRKGIFRDTLFDTSFNTFGAERYLTTVNNKAVRQAAALAPCDIAVVMVNTARYGGGGIYNFWSIFASDNEYDDYVFTHELGHAFAGLADEYFEPGASYDEDEFYPPGVEPWEPNLTAFLSGRRPGFKWFDLIGGNVPVPTPDDEKWKDSVGLFEGGGYKAKGLYRGYRDCKMFHKGLVPFCPVCRRSIEKMIDYYAGGTGG